MKNFHALFIGVDAYQKVTPLNGCVNDALMMFEYLNETVDRKAYNFQPTFLLSIHENKSDEYIKRFEGYGINYTINAAENLPTRNNMLGTLKNFQTKVVAGDVFFLFYAGHGSTEAAHPYFEEETGILQTLVPRDARVVVEGKKTKDVLDKEVRMLLRKIWENGTESNPVEMIFIQDSCHSAGATRSDMDKALEEIANVVFETNEANQNLIEESDEDPMAALLGDAEEDDPMADLLGDESYDDLQSDIQEEFARGEDENHLDENGMYKNVNEEKLAASRMVIASPEASAEYRAVEDFDFFDEDVKDAMRVYSNESDDGLRSRSTVFLDTESEEDKPRSVFIEEDDMDSRGGLESRSTGNSGNVGKRASGKKPPFNVAYPEANHIHMSACGKAEYAYEVKYPSGQKGGVFTNTIISLLKKFEGNISYHDLFNAAKLHIDGQFKQSPSIYVQGNPARRYERFLGGFIERKEGVYNLTYKPKQRQWRADVGAFLGLPILRLNETIPVKVLLDDQNSVDAEITYVLAETAVIEFNNSPAPDPSSKGLKVQIPTQYMSQAIPVYVEEKASYLAEDAIQKVMLDHKGNENSPYQLKMEKGKFRFYAKANPAEYVDLSQYQILSTDGLGYQPADIQLLYEANGPYTSYGIWQLLQSVFDRLRENPMSWIKMDFADGSSFLHDGAKFFTIDPNVDISSFFIPESREVISRFLNRYFEEQNEEGLLNLQSAVTFENPFKSHLAGINLEAFENHIEWTSKEDSKYTLRVVNGRYYVVKTADPYVFLSKGTENLDQKSVAKVLGYLRTISRWEMLYKLENPHPGSREMLDKLGLSFIFKANGKGVKLTVTYSVEQKKFQWFKDGEPIDALRLNYTDIDGFEMGYMGKMYVTRSNAIPEQTFFGALYLDYNFGIQPQDGVGSTEFFPFTSEKKEKIHLDINEMKTLPEIFNLSNEDARPSAVHTAVKFFIAFNRFDVSDWVQEGIPTPTDEDYEKQLEVMRSVMGRKTNPRAGDCVVLTLPLVLNIPDNLRPKPKDNNGSSIRGSL
jgi:hypothetical protein